MKIGFSFGQCIKDIVNKAVAFDDVMIIITGTNIRTRDRVAAVVEGYMYRRDYLAGMDETDCLSVAYALWDSGKVYEPRAADKRPPQTIHGNVWADLFPTIPSESESVRAAWDAYRLLLTLVEQMPGDTAQLPREPSGN